MDNLLAVQICVEEDFVVGVLVFQHIGGLMRHDVFVVDHTSDADDCLGDEFG